MPTQGSACFSKLSCTLMIIGALSPMLCGQWILQSSYEQLALELLNQARLDPAAEAERQGLTDLNDGLPPGTLDLSPKQPLASHPELGQTAWEHAQWLFESNTFSHTGRDGSNLKQRIEGGHYPWNSSAVASETINRILAEAFTGSEAYDRVERHFRDLFLNASSRAVLLNPLYDEAGIDFSPGTFSIEGADHRGTTLLTIILATSPLSPNPDRPFLTGVVYEDLDQDGRYTPGEGLHAVSIEAAYGASEAVSAFSGAYSLPFPQGSRFLTVRLNGPGFEDQLLTVQLPEAGNGKADFSPEEDALPDPWLEALAYSGNWFESEWFGWFCRMPNNWNFHLEHGYQFWIGGGSENIFLYDYAIGCWLFTTEQLYPSLYKFGENAGWYWYYKGGEQGKRWFWRKADRQYVQEADIERPVNLPPAGFSLIERGLFMMGSPVDEPGRSAEESLHQVNLSQSYYLQQREVTKAEWDLVLAEGMSRGYNDLPDGRNGWNGSPDGRHPVTEISWIAAVKWCNLRSELEGLEPCYTVDGNVYRSGEARPECDFSLSGYRLPTEAEWEYACRAGSETAFYSGPITHPDSGLDPQLDQIAWYSANAEGNTHPTGGKVPNAWGLYDLSGNVYEWCWDVYEESYYILSPSFDPVGPDSGENRVLRGGSCRSLRAPSCRSAARWRANESHTSYHVGFRPARTYQPKKIAKQ